MATNEDLGAQLKMQQDINKALQQRAGLLSKNTKEISTQVQLAAELCNAMECKDLEGMNDRLGEIQQSLSQVAEEADKAGTSTSDGMAKGAKSAEKAGKSVQKGVVDGLNAAKVAAVGFGVGIVSGVRSAVKQIKGLAKSIGNVTKSLFNVGKAVVSIPFKMMSGLIGMAQSGGGGGPSPIKVELEAIRGEFGSLASNEGQAVASSLGQIKGQMKDLAGTGLSVRQVFGAGKAGVAEAMKAVHEVATALGPALNGLQDSFKKSAVALAMYTKGLTGSAEGTAAMMKHFKAAGEDPVKSMDALASQAILMGKQFGVSSKTIGKNMAEMVKAVSQFGHLSKKELSATATYAAKLGIEIKDLGGVTDKFLNFEDAAQGAAQLQQAFGMTVDSMELMKGGASAIDELRKGFHNAGKSIKDMSAAERKLLETQTGLNGAALDAAFAADKQGLSYDELSAAAGENEEKQLTQAEAMKELSDNISKTFGGGGGGKTFKSFFDAFVQGFTKGIKKSKDFRKVMRNIRKSLKVVYKAGKEIGKMFVEMFPGVKQMMKGLQGLFDPKHFKKLMGKVKDLFKQFFTDIKTDPKAGTEKFIEGLKKAFGEFFSDRKGAAGEFKKGLGTFLKTMGAVLKVIGMMAVRGFAKLFKKIAEKIRNPPEMSQGMKDARDKLKDAFIELFKVLKEKVLPPVIAALKDFFTAVWEKAKPIVTKVSKIILKVMLTKLLITAFMSALKGGLVTLLIKAVAGFFGVVFKGAALKSPKLPGPGLTKTLGGFFKGLGALPAGDIAKAAGKLMLLNMLFAPAFIMFVQVVLLGVYNALSGINVLKFVGMMYGMSAGIGSIGLFVERMQYISMGDILKAIPKMVLMAVMVGVGVLAFGTALKLASGAMKGLSIKDVIVGMASMALAAVSAAIMAKAASHIDPGAAMKAALGLVAAAALIIAAVPMLIALLLIAPLASQMSPSDALGISLAFIAMAIISVALLVMVGATLPLQPGILVPAMLGLLGAALLITVGGIAFTLALGAVGAVMEGIGFKKIGKAFMMMAVVAASLFVISTSAASLMGVIIPAMMGMVLAAGFVLVMAHVFLPALQEVAGIDIPWKALGLAFLALIPIALGIMIAAPLIAVAGFLAILGMIGMYPAAAFVEMIAEKLLPAISEFVSADGFSSLAPAKAGFEALGVIMSVMGQVALASLMMIPFALPFIGGWLMKKGIKLVAKFLSMMAEHIIPQAEKFANMKVADPAAFKANMEALSGLMETVGTIGQVAVGLAEVELGAIEEAGANASVLGPVTAFMEVLFKHIGGLVDTIIGAMKTVDPKQAKVASAIADVLSAIGTLIGNIMEPLVGVVEMAMEANGSSSWFSNMDNKGFGQTMKAVSEFITAVMTAMSGSITKIVTAILKTPIPEGATSALLGKVKVIKAVMDAMAVFSKIAGDMVKKITESMAAQEENRSFWDKLRGKGAVNFKDVMNQMADVMDMLGNALSTAVPKIVKAMITAVDSAVKDPAAFGKKMDVVAKVIQVVGDSLKAISDAMTMVEKYKNSGESLTENIQWLFVDGGPFMDRAVVFAIAEGIGKGIVAIITELNKIPDPKGLMPKMKAASMAIKIAGDFVKAMTDIMGMMPEPSQATNMTKRLGQILDVIVSLTLVIGAAIPYLVSSIINIDVGDPQSTEARLKVISTVMKVIGDFSKAIKDMMSLMPKANDMAEVKKNAETMFGGGGVMYLIISRLMGEGGKYGIPDLVKSIVEGAAKITNPAQAEAQMKIVALAMQSVSDFASAIGSIMNLSPAAKDAEYVSESRLSSIIASVQRIANAVADKLPMLVNKILAIEIKNPKSAGKKMEVVGKVMEAVASFASALSSIQGIMPKTAPDVKPDIFGTIADLVVPIAIFLPALAGAIVGMFKRGKALRGISRYSRDIKALSSVFESVGHFVEAMQKLKGFEAAAGAAGGTGPLLARIAGIITNNKDQIQSIVTDFGGIKSRGKFPKDAFKNFSEFINVGLTPFISSVNAMPDLVGTKLTQVQVDFDKLKDTLKGVTKSRVLTDAIKVTNNLGKAGEVTVKGIPDKINFDIKINMDSDKVASAMLKTKKFVVAS